MYEEFFRHEGFDPVVMCGAKAAFDYAAARRATVIVIDIGSTADGVELIGRLRRDRRTRNIGIIVLSSRVFPHERAIATEAGCDVFLPKPCLPEALLGEIRRFWEENPAAAVEHETDAGVPR
jgi:two-component system cell cycle response regulator DivK